MVKSKNQKHFSFKWWYVLIIVFVLFMGWDLLSMANVDGNPFGVNNGRIETYINLVNMTGNDAEDYLDLYEINPYTYEDLIGRIEEDLGNLDRYESELTRYGVGEDEYVIIMLKSARLQLEGAKLQIMNLAGTN